MFKDYEFVPVEYITDIQYQQSGTYTIYKDLYWLVNDKNEVCFYGGYGFNMSAGNYPQANTIRLTVEVLMENTEWATDILQLPYAFVPLRISDYT